MKELINSSSISDLKKSRRSILICIIISLVIAIALIVPLFLFATRELRYLFIILLTIVASIEASFILYMCVVSLAPLNNYLKVSNLSLKGGKFQTKGKVVEISEKVAHFKGVAVKEMKVIDLEEENQEYIFYVEQHHSDEFVLDKTYTFITYQSLITGYEEDL